MLDRGVKTKTAADDCNTLAPAILFSFAAGLLMLLAVVPEPAAFLPVLALALMAQLTRLLGTKLYRDFTQ